MSFAQMITLLSPKRICKKTLGFIGNNYIEFATAFSLSVIIAFTVPNFVYLGNIEEFGSPFLYFQLFFLKTTLIVFALVFGFLKAVPQKTRDVFVPLIMSVSLLVYLQSVFFVESDKKWLLDGLTQIDTTTKLSVVSTVLWILLPLCSIIFFRKINQIIKPVLDFFIVLLTITFFSSCFQIRNWSHVNFNNVSYRAKIDEDFFRFSKNKNVVVFVLDTINNRIAQEALADLKKENLFNDFTYLTDFTASYPHTHYSVSAFLSGELYDFEENFKDFIERVQTSSKSIPVMMKKKGYKTKIFTNIPFYSYSSKIYDNILSTKSISSGDKSKILSTALIRMAPYPFKSYFMKEEVKQGGTNVWNNNSVQETFKNNTFKNDENKNQFFIFHIEGAHAPYKRDEFSRPKENATYSDIAKEAFRTVNAFLSKMKEIGVYDQSVVMIFADHGNPAAEALPERANILAMYKPLHTANSQTVYNDTPISNIRTPEILSMLEDGKNNIDDFKMPERFFYNYRMDSPVPEKIIVSADASKPEAYLKTGEFVNKGVILKDGEKLLPKDMKKKAFSKECLKAGRINCKTNITHIKMFPKLSGDFSIVKIRFSKIKSKTIKVNTAVYPVAREGKYKYAIFPVRNNKRILVDIKGKYKINHIQTEKTDIFDYALNKGDYLNSYEISLLLKQEKADSVAEETGIWIKSKKAFLEIPVSEKKPDHLRVQLKLTTILDSDEKDKNVNIRISDENHPVTLSKYFITKEQSYIVPMAKVGNVLKIMFDTDYLTFYNEAGGFLGIRIGGVKFSEASAIVFETGREYKMTQSDAGTETALFKGWHSPENNGTWTSSPKAEARFELASAPKKDVNVFLNVWLLNTPGNFLKITAPDGTSLYERKFTEGSGNEIISFRYPAALIKKDKTVRLTLESKAARYDHLYPGSGDTRTLGVLLTSVKLDEVSQ